jgi:uncharacterized protein YkwD
MMCRSTPLLAAVLACHAALVPTQAQAAQPGERYMVRGRCVTITAVDAGQASYEWRQGNSSGSGNLPGSALGPRCSEDMPPAGASGDDAPARAQAPSRPQAPGAGTANMGNTGNTGNTATMANPATSSTGDGEREFADQILRAHNRYRCMHGAAPLSWHPEVAAYARRWVEQLGSGGLRHSDSYRAGIGPLGENLYGGSAGLPSGEAAVRMWYEESRGYDYQREGGMAAGHFTAMIWKDARYLGCGRAHGKISCNYGSGKSAPDCSTPNMSGCSRQQVLAPIKPPQACQP